MNEITAVITAIAAVDSWGRDHPMEGPPTAQQDQYIDVEPPSSYDFS